MVQLLLTFLSETEVTRLVLHPVDKTHVSILPGSNISDATFIHQGNEASIYKGKLVQEGLSPEEVVLKCVPTYRLDASYALKSEFRFYCNKLKNIQGVTVPKCYGLFRAKKGKTLYLILQHCGKPLEWWFNEIDMDQK